MYSLYEIETTVKRVARHLGLSWGIAEEAGKVVRSLEQSELPGLESFSRLVHFPYSKCQTAIDISTGDQDNLCPIHFGLFFLDQSHDPSMYQSFKFSNMQEPLLAIPLLIKAAQKNLISFEFSSTEIKFLISSGNIMTLDKNEIPHQLNNISLKISNQRQQQYSLKTWERLYELSLETFVEESEKTKLSGAGAGLTDND